MRNGPQFFPHRFWLNGNHNNHSFHREFVFSFFFSLLVFHYYFFVLVHCTHRGALLSCVDANLNFMIVGVVQRTYRKRILYQPPLCNSNDGQDGRTGGGRCTSRAHTTMANKRWKIKEEILITRNVQNEHNARNGQRQKGMMKYGPMLILILTVGVSWTEVTNTHAIQIVETRRKQQLNGGRRCTHTHLSLPQSTMETKIII